MKTASQLADLNKIVGQPAIAHPNYDTTSKHRKILNIRTSESHPNKIVFDLEGIEGGIIEDYVWVLSMKKPKWASQIKECTIPQLKLINELDLNKLIKKQFINKEYPTKEYPQRSGNLETPPANNDHRKILGFTDNPHNTANDKNGYLTVAQINATPTKMDDPTSIDITNKTNVSFKPLKKIGQPYSRGIKNKPVGDDAELAPNSTNNKPQRLIGPTERPGAQTYTSFGNRYPGVKSINF